VQKLYELEVRLSWWVILPRYLTCRSFSLLRGANWQVHQALHANYVILFKFRKWDCLWSERSVVYKAETPYKPELVPKQDRWPSPHWVSCGLRWFCAKLSTGMDLEVIKIISLFSFFLIIIIILKNTFEGTTSFKTLLFSFNDSFVNNINCTNELSANPFLLSLYPKNKRIWKKQLYPDSKKSLSFYSLHSRYNLTGLIWIILWREYE